jgi:uncharacterized membrane protein HdeD (DUF308 family)
MNRSIRNSLAAHWRLIMAQGVIMVILGALALAAPAFATLAVDIYVGWLFLFSGLLGLVAIFSATHPARFRWGMVTAGLSLVLGVMLVWKPAEGALSLTAVLTAFFIAEGLFQAITSVAYRYSMRSTWGWMLASGFADLALAAVILAGWPMTAGWALGIIAGVNLITSGWAIAMAALAGREVANAIAPFPTATPR